MRRTSPCRNGKTWPGCKTIAVSPERSYCSITGRGVAVVLDIIEHAHTSPTDRIKVSGASLKKEDFRGTYIPFLQEIVTQFKEKEAMFDWTDVTN